jgi:hypothetical protein
MIKISKSPLVDESSFNQGVEKWIRCCISTGVITPPPDEKPVPKVIRIKTEDGQIIWPKPKPRRMIQIR